MAKQLPAFSVDTARQKLTTAGWTLVNGKFEKAGKPLAITLIGRPEQAGGPEYMLTQLNAVGATVKLNMYDRATYTQQLFSGNWDVATVAGVNGIPDPSISAVYFTGPAPTAGSNYARINDPDLEREVAAARAATGAESCRAWSNVQRLILQHSHFAPLATPVYSFFSRGFDFLPFAQAMELYSIRRRA